MIICYDYLNINFLIGFFFFELVLVSVNVYFTHTRCPFVSGRQVALHSGSVLGRRRRTTRPRWSPVLSRGSSRTDRRPTALTPRPWRVNMERGSEIIRRRPQGAPGVTGIPAPTHHGQTHRSVTYCVISVISRINQYLTKSINTLTQVNQYFHEINTN